METINIPAFNIIGLSVRTTNENNRASIDIPALWTRIMTEQIAGFIPNKESETLYCIYTEYEKDHTRPYTTLLGCKVSNLEEIPDGLTGISFAGGTYKKITAKGNILEGMVFNEWTKIWNADLPRAYTADFEVYNERAQNMEDAEVDIYIALKG